MILLPTSVLIYTWIWPGMQGRPPKVNIQNKNIYAIHNHRNGRVLLIAQLASLFFWIQHTLKPVYAKFGAFLRKWRSISHIRYTIIHTCNPSNLYFSWGRYATSDTITRIVYRWHCYLVIYCILTPSTHLHGTSLQELTINELSGRITFCC